jgi:hypothetical protein
VRGRTALDSYEDNRIWLVDAIKKWMNEGASEWGTQYDAWTALCILNLAEFAEDDEVRQLAIGALDYWLARQAGFAIDGRYVSGGVRRYGHWLFEPVPPQTSIAEVLFLGDKSDTNWVEWAASTWRPLAVVDALYDQAGPFEAQITELGKYHHYAWHLEDVALATQQNLASDTFTSPETHDVITCIAQSRAGIQSWVVNYNIQPGDTKYRSKMDRSWGYGGIAFCRGGGDTRKAWSAGTRAEVPLRLFYDTRFEVQLEGGWAFLTDGSAYIGWAPTRGSPKQDPDALDWTGAGVGGWLVSTYTPDAAGETAIMEVGDASSHGSYAAFKADLLSRHGDPSWEDGHVVVTAADGAELDFSGAFMKVDGVEQDPGAWPRAAHFGLDGATVFDGSRTAVLDATTGSWSGDNERLASDWGGAD